MMDKAALERQGALLEIIMGMRRQFSYVAHPNLRVEHVNHKGRTTPDSPETAVFGRNVEAVSPKFVAAPRSGPRLKWGNVGAMTCIGGVVGTASGKIFRARGEQSCNHAPLWQCNETVARRYKPDEEAVLLDGLPVRGEFDRRVAVSHEYGIFVDLTLSTKAGAPLGFGMRYDKVLTAQIPGAAIRVVVGWGFLIEKAELDWGKIARNLGLGGGWQPSAGVGGDVHQWAL